MDLECEQFIAYRLFQKSIVYLMLLSLVWVNTAFYICTLFDSDIEFVEFYNSGDGESEDVFDRIEILDRMNSHSSSLSLLNLFESNRLFHLDKTPTSYHLEILTPPPEVLI